MRSPEQNSFPLHEFVDNYKPVPYTGASVEQTIMHLEGKSSSNIPWHGSCNLATRDGFLTKINRYDVDNAPLTPTPQHPTPALHAYIKFCNLQPASYHPLVATNKADAQSKKRSAAIAEFIVEEQTARRESETPRAYFDSSDSPIEYKIVDPDPASTKGILDSGASISVTNPRTVAYYGLTLIPWDTGPVRIQFGDGNVETSTHYVNLNSVFTEIAVMENAPDTLISIFDLVLARFEIKQKLVGTGIYLNDNLVFPGTICHQTILFYMDLNAIVNSNILVPQLSQATCHPTTHRSRMSSYQRIRASASSWR